MDNLPYLLALHSVDGLGPIRLKKILDYFKDPKEIWGKPLFELKNLGIPDGVLEKLDSARKTLVPEDYARGILSSGIKVVSLLDENYPQALNKIYDPPIVLYYKGDISCANSSCFGIVGTRKITGYGRIVTHQFSFELSKKGLTIVSGLARGVDTVAHQAAIEAKGKTIAVLGGGLNNIFPPENTILASNIINGHGAVITEFPPDYPALPGNFPSRNRIIAGLSLAVLVTEAAVDSGSLITARLALEEGRGVFAVPGPITSPLSEGSADLIKEGASLAFSVEDILNDLGINSVKPITSIDTSSLSDNQKQILDSLALESKHIDEICRQLNLPSASVSASLIQLEILGLVKSLGGGNYLKAF